MDRRCPNCKSFNVRRSSAGSRGASGRTYLRSPYRCRDCAEKFWVIGRNTYQYAGIGLAVSLPLFTLIAGFIILMMD